MNKHRTGSPTPLAAIARLHKTRADMLALIIESDEDGYIHDVARMWNEAAPFIESALEAEHYNYPTEAELSNLLNEVKGAWSAVETIVRTPDSVATADTYKMLLDRVIEAAVDILDDRNMLPEVG
jgi:hypothetical protein